MKKFIFLSLLIITSNSYATSLKNVLWSLIEPFENMEKIAEIRLRDWHKKKANGAYLQEDERVTYDGHKMGNLRSLYPLEDATSIDRLTKMLILAKYNRLYKIAVRAESCNGMPAEIYAPSTGNWNNESITDRFLWTIEHRSPYTYFATLGKWGCEIAIIALIIKSLYKLKKKLIKNKDDEQQVEIANITNLE